MGNILDSKYRVKPSGLREFRPDLASVKGQSRGIFRRWTWLYFRMHAKNLSLFLNGLSNKKEQRLISSQTPRDRKVWPNWSVFDTHGVKSSKQIEFCGCIIAGVHGAFAAGSSILGVLFDANLNHLDLHGKLIKIKNIFYKMTYSYWDYKVVCGFPMVVVSIQYRLYCSKRNSDEMTNWKTHPTLTIFLKFYFFISYKFFFFTFMAIQNDCRIFYKKGYQKNANLWLVCWKVTISSANLITYTSDTISMVQQGPDCKFRKGSTS